jgi:hypothetical protein
MEDATKGIDLLLSTPTMCTAFTQKMEWIEEYLISRKQEPN